MFGLARTTVLALGVAFGLAIVGVIVVQRFNAGVIDAIGLACVLAGVHVAALTDTESATS